MAVSRPEGGGILVCRAVSRLVRRRIDGLTRTNGQNPLPRPAVGLGQPPPISSYIDAAIFGPKQSLCGEDGKGSVPVPKPKKGGGGTVSAEVRVWHGTRVWPCPYSQSIEGSPYSARPGLICPLCCDKGKGSKGLPA